MFKIKLLDDKAKVPYLATEGSAAGDLTSIEDAEIYPGGTVAVRTGIAVEIPKGFAAFVLPRSGKSLEGLQIANAPGLIDSDYRGELKVIIFNASDSLLSIKQGERIAQLFITDYIIPLWEVVEELSETERGTGGLGSSGR